MPLEELFDELPSDWDYITLGEACSRGGGGVQTGPFGSQLHAADYVAEGIPSIMPLNIGENRVIEDGIARITAKDATRLNRYLVQKGDIVYSRRGDVERRALIREHEDGWLCGTGCLRVRLGENGANPTYASYYLGHPAVREWIVRHAQGATMPNLNTSILSALPFVFPPPNEQRAIASVLGALDDKIELNRRMNETLEALAQTLFKSWFVDATQSALPKGWRVSTIGEEVRVMGGSTPSTSKPEFWDGGTHHWATPKDLSNLSSPVLLDTERRITDAGLQEISSGLLPAGTVLMSSRAPIGYIAISEVPVAVNQGFIALVCDKSLPNYFVRLWLKNNMEAIEGRANGTTFMEISKSNFRPMQILVPPSSLLDEFAKQVEPLHRRMVSNLNESRTLAALREALLPKLLSGELRVPTAAKLLEAHA